MYGWIQAIDEAMVTHHLGVADEYDSYDTARRKLNELIDWHVAVATDPRVNGGWQLVPVEATPEMLKQGFIETQYDEGRGNRMEVYRAMLAAAPASSTATTTP